MRINSAAGGGGGGWAAAASWRFFRKSMPGKKSAGLAVSARGKPNGSKPPVGVGPLSPIVGPPGVVPPPPTGGGGDNVREVPDEPVPDDPEEPPGGSKDPPPPGLWVNKSVQPDPTLPAAPVVVGGGVPTAGGRIVVEDVVDRVVLVVEDVDVVVEVWAAGGAVRTVVVVVGVEAAVVAPGGAVVTTDGGRAAVVVVTAVVVDTTLVVEVVVVSGGAEVVEVVVVMLVVGSCEDVVGSCVVCSCAVVVVVVATGAVKGPSVVVVGPPPSAPAAGASVTGGAGVTETPSSPTHSMLIPLCCNCRHCSIVIPAGAGVVEASAGALVVPGAEDVPEPPGVGVSPDVDPGTLVTEGSSGSGVVVPVAPPPPVLVTTMSPTETDVVGAGVVAVAPPVVLTFKLSDENVIFAKAIMTGCLISVIADTYGRLAANNGSDVNPRNASFVLVFSKDGSCIDPNCVFNALASVRSFAKIKYEFVISFCVTSCNCLLARRFSCSTVLRVLFTISLFTKGILAPSVGDIIDFIHPPAPACSPVTIPSSRDPPHDQLPLLYSRNSCGE